MQNKCLECENEAILDLSSLQVDFCEIKREYEGLEKAFSAYREYAETKIEHLQTKADKCNMWHDGFKDISSKLDIFRNDPYFENLNLEQISALAKKSIRLTSDNTDMMHDFEEIKTLLENINVFDSQKDRQEALKQAIELAEKHII